MGIKIEPNRLVPKLLFHGSPVQGLSTLKPGSQSARLFATPDLRLALPFLLEDYKFMCGRSADFVYTCICAEAVECIRHDRGGAIYILTPEHFQSNPGNEMKTLEWTSDQQIEPLACLTVKSALAAMLAHGLHVYFTNDHQFAKLEASRDNVPKLLRQLQVEQLTVMLSRSHRPELASIPG